MAEPMNMATTKLKATRISVAAMLPHSSPARASRIITSNTASGPGQIAALRDDGRKLPKRDERKK